MRDWRHDAMEYRDLDRTAQARAETLIALAPRMAAALRLIVETAEDWPVEITEGQAGLRHARAILRELDGTPP